MKQLNIKTSKLIDLELRSIPEKYHRNFSSVHEGYAVLLEEVRELENEVFFGEKKNGDNHKQRLREEAIQVAAMAVRIIQELT